MNSFKQAVLNFIREEEGLTIVEYAIAGGLISVAVALAFTDLGAAVNDVIVALAVAVRT
jgi:pilus assembly protein Flp/PilA